MRKIINCSVSILTIILFLINILIISAPMFCYESLNLIDCDTPLERKQFETKSALTIEQYHGENYIKVYKTESEYDTFNDRTIRSIAISNEDNIAILQNHYNNISGISIYDYNWNFVCGYTIIIAFAEFIEWNENCLNLFAQKGFCVSLNLSDDTYSFGNTSDSFQEYAQEEFNFNGEIIKLSGSDIAKKLKEHKVYSTPKYFVLTQVDANGDEIEIINVESIRLVFNIILVVELLIFALFVLFRILTTKNRY